MAIHQYLLTFKMDLLKLSIVACLLVRQIEGSTLNEIERGIDEYVKSNEVPSYLKPAISDFFGNAKGAFNEAMCSACESVASTGIQLRRNGTSEEGLKNFSMTMCTLFTDYSLEVCQGSAELNIPTMIYVIDNKKDLTAKRVCFFKMAYHNCKDPDYKPWSIDIPEGSSPQLPEKNTTAEEIKLVHITDIHYDPLYEPGSNAVCDNRLCCQGINGLPQDPKNAAGYWGDYRVCDTPWHAVENLFSQVIKQHPQIDLVYFSGDIISHQIWSTSRKYNTDAITRITNKFQETFKEIPVYGVLGNHESHPSDFYVPDTIEDDNLSTKWLMKLMAKQWGQLLPQEAIQTIEKGGYYTVLIKPGFRLIGLNSNVCYLSNLWLIWDDRDPYDQLKWLVDVLTEAEKNQEAVHILAHVAPGGCLQQWNHEFRRIVDRFSNIITGQFNGHTHYDEIRIFYGLNNTNEVVNVAFNGGSLTTYAALGNPNYKIYDVETNYHKVLDYEQWYYNLEEANLDPKSEPNWKKLYSFKNAYGLESLEFEDYDKFVRKLSDNSTLLNDYRRFFYRESDTFVSKECDGHCMAKFFCGITGVESHDSLQCTAYKQKHNLI